MTKLLLCTDMDRTLLPNGDAPLSPTATSLFQQLVAQPEVMLAYVTGRNLSLLEQAVEEFQVPPPDFAITDVGATIYQRQHGRYQPLTAWQEKLEQEWSQEMRDSLPLQLGHFEHLALQPDTQQGRFKLSFQVTPSEHLEPDLTTLKQRLDAAGLEASVIVSVDETLDEGLVDLLPPSANKRSATEFLATKLQLSPDQLFFSGDSGNDLALLISPFPATLVANATEQVRQQALLQAQQTAESETLYLAKGLPELELNGNYCAGIVEGFLHYFPHARHWLKTELNHES